MPSSLVSIVSKTTIKPHKTSTLKPLKLSVSDLPMLSCYYIQKGVLLPRPSLSSADLISLLKTSLSETLSRFPPLAGRLSTDPSGHVHIICNDSGVDFIHARALHLYQDQVNLVLIQDQVLVADSQDNVLYHDQDNLVLIQDQVLAADSHNQVLYQDQNNLVLMQDQVLAANSQDLDLDPSFKEMFAYDNTLSYEGHFRPLVAVQVTELGDGVFIGCTVNHAVVDGTSFWNFFNAFSEASRGGERNFSKSPDFSRDTVFDSPAVLKMPAGGPSATFSSDAPLRERIFRFSRESILNLKLKANSKKFNPTDEMQSLDLNGGTDPTVEISSFQALCAQLWRSVTRARNLEGRKMTTFRMAVNCRHRITPPLDPLYFGNAIQSIPTVGSVGDVLSRDLRWLAERIHENVFSHDDKMVRRGVSEWEKNPRLFPLGNFDGATITMGSSPRFPMYDNDFGWGRPVAIRSGKANKFDGKISAFPGREGGRSVDLEVVLSPDTMAGLERDTEFMQYVS